ncbi:MAG: hypothetical protein H0V09_00110, partial [Gemmatimonadetes bacterium]|nr:hypothetical protein [Gemmatimonadota bacterium]
MKAIGGLGRGSWLALAACLWLAACQPGGDADVDVDDAGDADTTAGSASMKGSLADAADDGGQWVMTGRTYDLQRFSPLEEITAANVHNLRVAWTFSTGTLRGHEGNPLVLNNTMYVHTSFPNIVYALDLTKEGAPMKWKHVPDQPADVIPIACCD